MIEGKEKFIERISHCLGRKTLPSKPTPFILPHAVHHDYLRDANLDELEATFIKNSKASGTTIYQCKPDDLNGVLIEAVTAFGGGRVLMADHDFFKVNNTFEAINSHCKHLQMWDTNLSREENIAYAEQASVGITMAELALAESGTVLLFSHLGSGRSVSLLPAYTVTVIRKKDIRPRLTQAMSFLKEQIVTGLPSSINFISGASSTADIELVRVQGVHGPLAISYIIVG